MIKLLRLRKGGFHYDEINDWCKRMVATTIMSEASIFLADRRQYASDTFHVFDRVVLVGEELHDGSRSEFYQVYLSHWDLTRASRGGDFKLTLCPGHQLLSLPHFASVVKSDGRAPEAILPRW